MPTTVQKIGRARLVVLACSILAIALLGTTAPALAAAPPSIEEAAVTEVTTTSATLSAVLNPDGAQTSYTFEYAPAGGAFAPVPESEGSGSGLEGTAALLVSVRVQHGLQPASSYAFRVTVHNALGSVISEPVPFSTQPVPGGFALLDGRQWELVSPPNKHGGLLASRRQAGVIQASEDGSAITYQTTVPPEAEPPGYGQQEEFLSQLLSKRGAQGWSTRDIAGKHEAPTNDRERFSEYLFFSPDLSSSLLYPTGADGTLLSALASEPTPYVRREALCGVPASVGECYFPVLTGKEGYADVPPGTVFGRAEGLAGGANREVEFEGASPDLSHVLLKSRVALTKIPIEHEEIYAWSAGAPPAQAVQLVSELPPSEGGGPAPSLGVAIGPDPNGSANGVRHSVSLDGSRVFWETSSGGETRLYLRDTTRPESIRLDLQQPGAPAGELPEARFQAASADGSRAFFTDPQRLMTGSGTAPNGNTGDLYECRIVEEGGHLHCALSDLTPVSAGVSAEVQGILSGVSDDASYVYFVANGVLGDGAKHGATQGTCASEVVNSTATCNLYVYHEGEVRFIATLSAEDEFDWGNFSASFHETGSLTAQASPDGRYFTFMSDRSLTGYDNRDAHSGRPAMEVFLYDAVAGRLVCASCNPTGSRPVGVELKELESQTGGGGSTPHSEDIVGMPVSEGFGALSPGSFVAANLPGSWIGEHRFLASLRQAHYLSDSGRLFFNTSDALVPADVNGTEDVYEFEPVGVGSCSTSAVTFVARSGGCVALVSSGTSPQESGFMDASAKGPAGGEAEDVFFLTTSPLSTSDKDTAYDVYDAHVCSAVVPCTAAASPPPPCGSESSCRAAPSSQPAIFGAPSSATFSGPGNLTPAAVGLRPLTRAQLLTRALHACHRLRRHRRVACERQARHRYGAHRARRAKRATRGGGR